jgi:hypothetical protein
MRILHRLQSRLPFPLWQHCTRVFFADATQAMGIRLTKMREVQEMRHSGIA